MRDAEKSVILATTAEGLVRKADRLRPLLTDEVKVMLENINSIRRQVSQNIEDSKIVQMLKFVSDTYDLRILAETVGFNDNYFEEAEQDWFNGDHLDLRNIIAKATLP